MEVVFAVTKDVLHCGKDGVDVFKLKLILVDQVDDSKHSWLEDKLILPLEGC